MTDTVKTVKIRLVPHNRSGHPLPLGEAMTSSLPKDNIRANAQLARDAMQKSLSQGMTARVTARDRVEMRLTPEATQEMFKAEVLERKIGDLESDDKGTQLLDSYFTTREKLEVPEHLKEEIEFAHIPTPPTFFDVSPIPPKVALHHLSLDSVRSVLGGARCHRRGWTGKDIKVAMVDSGFSQHPYFRQRGFNYNPIATPQQPDPLTDPSGHGTGESANIFTLAPDIEFFGYRFGGSSAEDLESALDGDASIISNSWGWSADNQSLADLQQSNPNQFFEFQDISSLIVDAVGDGKIVIFSAGNGHFAFPGSHPEVISAGGTTINADGSMQASSYASSFRSQFFPGRAVPDVCGIVGESVPGATLPGHIMLPVPNGANLEGENMPANKSNLGWGIFSGTSAAAPQLAGAVALMQHARESVGKPTLTAAQAKAILASTAIDVTTGQSAMGEPAGAGFDDATGAGLIDAFEACLAATNL